jgi:hypothetical protein
MLNSVKGQIAICQPVFRKIETELQGGLAINSNRLHLQEVKVVMAYDNNGIHLMPGDRVILPGAAGLQQWAKQKMILGDVEFVLCPESQIMGYITE